MKNKMLAVALSLAIGAMNFMPSMSVNASSYVDTCYRCGGYNSTYVVVNRTSDVLEAKLCEHGYGDERVSDYLIAYYERVNYYCADCNVNWEQDEFLGMEWVCGHNN